MTTQVRKGQAPGNLERAEFGARFRHSFVDPAFHAEDEAIARLEAIAWDAYCGGRKSPLQRKAGPGYADPDYELAIEWLETRERLDRAQRAWSDPKTVTRALVICGSPRNDGTCPGEISKTFRLAGLVKEVLVAEQIEVDFLDLSLDKRVYGLVVHGDVAGIEGSRRALSDWLDWMGLVDTGEQVAARPFRRLLRAVCDEPRRARPRPGGAGRDEERRPRRCPQHARDAGRPPGSRAAAPALAATQVIWCGAAKLPVTVYASGKRLL